MLYTFAKTFHEQTLSFAAENPNQELVQWCSAAPEFVEDFSDWSSRSRCAYGAGGDWICCRLHFQTFDSQAEGGRCDRGCFPGRDTVSCSVRPQAKRCSTAFIGPQQNSFRRKLFSAYRE